MPGISFPLTEVCTSTLILFYEGILNKKIKARIFIHDRRKPYAMPTLPAFCPICLAFKGVNGKTRDMDSLGSNSSFSILRHKRGGNNHCE